MEEDPKPENSIEEDVRVEREDDDIEIKDESFGYMSMSHNEKFTILTFCFANFCVGALYSLLAPFFPQEALKKGANSTWTGLILGCFELIIICFSPIFGNYLTRIGAKFLYCTGVISCGLTTVMFGFLDRSPDGSTYIGMCFAVRFFEGIAAAAFITASFAIMANTFPNNVATVFGSLELFSGLGLMLGPPIGGALFQVGGFTLPFVSMGCLLVFVGALSIFLLPRQDDVHDLARGSIFSLLKIPLVVIVGLLAFLASACIGFLDVSLAIFLEHHFSFTPIVLGAVFLVGPGVYAFTAPLWGCFADKYPRHSWKCIFIGYILGGTCLFFFGPAPFLPIKSPMLWLIILCWGLMGLGIGTIVIAFQIITMSATDAGHAENLDTFGLISGVFNMFFSLGAFVGPIGGGALVDNLGFEWSAAIFGAVTIFGAGVLFVYKTLEDISEVPNVSSLPQPSRQPEGDIEQPASETSPLLGGTSGRNQMTVYSQEVVT